jgi:hypothetical protein
MLLEASRYADIRKKKRKKDQAVAPLGGSSYTTRSKKQNAANALRPAALDTTEILEQILKYLSPQQIFSL